jgi:hypothetical protein
MSNMTKISKKKQHKNILSSDIGCTWGIETTDEAKEVESREVRNAWITEEVKVAQFCLSPPIESIFMDCQTSQKNLSILTQVGNWWRWCFGTMNKWENYLDLDFESCSFLSLKGFDHKLDGFKIHPSSFPSPKVVFHASMNLHIQFIVT